MSKQSSSKAEILDRPTPKHSFHTVEFAVEHHQLRAWEVQVQTRFEPVGRRLGLISKRLHSHHFQRLEGVEHQRPISMPGVLKG